MFFFFLVQLSSNFNCIFTIFLLSFMAGCVLCIFPWHECPAKLRPVACVGVNSVAFNMPFHKFLRLLTLFTQMCAKATNNNANQLFITPYVAHTYTQQTAEKESQLPLAAAIMPFGLVVFDSRWQYCRFFVLDFYAISFSFCCFMFFYL